MTNDDISFDDTPRKKSIPGDEPARANDELFGDEHQAQPLEASKPERTPPPEPAHVAVPPPRATSDQKILDDLAVLDTPEPPPPVAGAAKVVEPNTPTDDWSEPQPSATAAKKPEALAPSASSDDSNVASDDQILADLAALDAPEPPPRPSKNVVPVTDPPPGDPHDLSLHEAIFNQKVPVRVIRHPRGGKRIIVGTGGGVDSYIAETWLEKYPSVVPAHRDSRGRRIVMAGYMPGLRVRCVTPRGTAYLMVTDQGLRLVKKAIYQGK